MKCLCGDVAQEKGTLFLWLEQGLLHQLVRDGLCRRAHSEVRPEGWSALSASAGVALVCEEREKEKVCFWTPLAMIFWPLHRHTP